MCLVLIAYNVHPRYPVVIAANRDEFYQRPASPAQFWEDHPEVLGGRDLKQGGTWLAVDRRGRMAAVTNYREPSERKENLRSRGFLVTDYLFGGQSPQAYLSALSGHIDEYDGFNIFAGDASSLYFYGSYLEKPMAMEPGIHGISNGDLDYPWPKVTRGKQALSEVIAGNEPLIPGPLFDILLDREVPEDYELPDTGVGVELERMLAPIFVMGGNYGTRSSTVLLIDQHAGINFSEKTFDSEGRQLEEVDFTFKIS